ncbi:MAG TPA: response regulator [Anaerolineae bacterium]|nr:response regulator [Anaerolineae bacterium]
MSAHAKQKRILIVDDEAIVAFFLMEGLQGLGDEYDVRTSASAESALEQVQHGRFDLAVVDYRLPGLNGLDLIRRLREISPETHTIVITAYSSPELEHEALRLRASRYLEKPFRIQDLMCTIEEVLS